MKFVSVLVVFVDLLCIGSAFPQGFGLLRKNSGVASENAVVPTDSLEEDRDETSRALIEMMTFGSGLEAMSYSFSMSYSLSFGPSIFDEEDEGEDESDPDMDSSKGGGEQVDSDGESGSSGKTTSVEDEEESNKNLAGDVNSSQKTTSLEDEDSPSSGIIAVSVLLGTAMGIAAFVFVTKRMLRPSRAAMSLASDDGSLP